MKTGRPANVFELTVLQDEDYLAPPEGSTPRFCEEWYRVVNDFPASWFRSSDIPILVEYVQQILVLERIHREMKKLGDNFIVVDRFGVPKAHPLMAILGKSQQNLKMLATAVKTSPQSRDTQVPKKQKSRGESAEASHDPLSGAV
jgi:phage terminase small subunit